MNAGGPDDPFAVLDWNCRPRHRSGTKPGGQPAAHSRPSRLSDRHVFLACRSIGRAEHREAKALAQEIFARLP